MGLYVPQDVSLISLGSSEIGRCYQPALTALDAHPCQLGMEAFALMLRLLNGQAQPPASATVPCILIARDSVADLT